MFSFYLLLPILVSGFITCNIILHYRYKLYRYDSQYLYLKVLQLGTICLIFGTFLSICLNSLFNEQISVCNFTIDLNFVKFLQDKISNLKILDKTENINYLAWTIFISICTLLIPFLWYISWKFIFNRKFPLKEDTNLKRDNEIDTEKSPKNRRDTRIKYHVLGKILQDSPLDYLLYISYIKKIPVMLSLKDRKVYVGLIVSTGEPNESEGPDQEVSILPIMSGYRKTDDLTVQYTTEYEDFDEDLYLTIRQEKIISATQFSFTAHENNKQKFVQEILTNQEKI